MSDTPKPRNRPSPLTAKQERMLLDDIEKIARTAQSELYRKNAPKPARIQKAEAAIKAWHDQQSTASEIARRNVDRAIAAAKRGVIFAETKAQAMTMPEHLRKVLAVKS